MPSSRESTTVPRPTALRRSAPRAAARVRAAAGRAPAIGEPDQGDGARPSSPTASPRRRRRRPPAWSGAAPIARRGWWSSAPRPRPSANPRRVIGPAALEDSDFTARVAPAPTCPAASGSSIASASRTSTDLRRWSEPVVGSRSRRRRAPRPARDVTLAWSADTVGQGWGIDHRMRRAAALREHAARRAGRCSSTAATPSTPTSRVGRRSDARRRRRVAQPGDAGARAKPAETLDEFRGNYRYNLLDEHMRRFNAAVGQLTMWDDHEVRDNWYPERRLDGDTRYTVKSVALLAARARQAFLEYTPLPFDAGDPERIYRARAATVRSSRSSCSTAQLPRRQQRAIVQPALERRARRSSARRRWRWLKAALARQRPRPGR